MCRYLQSKPELRERSERLKELVILKARKAVIDGFDKDPNLALKYLEKKKHDEFGIKAEITGTIEEKRHLYYHAIKEVINKTERGEIIDIKPENEEPKKLTEQ